MPPKQRRRRTGVQESVFHACPSPSRRSPGASTMFSRVLPLVIFAFALSLPQPSRGFSGGVFPVCVDSTSSTQTSQDSSDRAAARPEPPAEVGRGLGLAGARGLIERVRARLKSVRSRLRAGQRGWSPGAKDKDQNDQENACTGGHCLLNRATHKVLKTIKPDRSEEPKGEQC